MKLTNLQFVQPSLFADSLKQHVISDTGHVGWGEGYGPAGVIKAGIEHLTPFILEENPLETEVIWNIMYRRTLD